MTILTGRGGGGGEESRNGISCLLQRETTSIHFLCMLWKGPWTSFNNITGPFWQSSLGNEKALCKAVLLLKATYLLQRKSTGHEWLDIGIVRIGEIL